MPTQPFGIFGEVLFDCFPDGVQVLGGAPFNVAWHLHAFGYAPLFISRIGADEAGKLIQTAMQNWGMATTGLQIDPHHATGQVAITLCDGEPEYRILDHQAYDYIDAEQLPATNMQILYHGSLALRHPVSAQALEALKNRHPAKIFIDVNLRSPWWHKSQVLAWLNNADWLKLNDLELLQLEADGQTLADKMRILKQRLNLEGLVVTCGANGAKAIAADDAIIEVKPPENLCVVDTVGAGDAFSAVVLIGILHNWPLQVILQHAQDFAAALVEKRGAIVMDAGFYQNFKFSV